MKIRQVKESDNPHLSKMIRKVFEEHDAPKNGTVYSDPTTNYLYESFQIEKSVLWVAENNNKILGCCGVYPTAGLPEQCVEVYIESVPQFSKAINMYQKQGFIKLNNPLGTSGHTSCNIWMLKKL